MLYDGFLSLLGLMLRVDLWSMLRVYLGLWLVFRVYLGLWFRFRVDLWFREFVSCFEFRVSG